MRCYACFIDVNDDNEPLERRDYTLGEEMVIADLFISIYMYDSYFMTHTLVYDSHASV